MQSVPGQKSPSSTVKVLRLKKATILNQKDNIKNAIPKNVFARKDYKHLSNLIAEREPHNRSSEKQIAFTPFDLKARESLNRVYSRISHARSDYSFIGAKDYSKESEYRFTTEASNIAMNKSGEIVNIRFGLQKKNSIASPSPLELEVGNSISPMTPLNNTPTHTQKNFLVLKEFNRVSPTAELGIMNQSGEKVVSPIAAIEGRYLQDGYNIPLRRHTIDKKDQNKYTLNVSSNDNSLVNPFIIKSISKSVDKTAAKQQNNDHIFVDSEDAIDAIDASTKTSYQRVTTLVGSKILNILSGKRRSQDITLTSPSIDMNQQNPGSQQQPQQAQKKRPKLKLVPIYDCKLTHLTKVSSTTTNHSVTKINFNLNTNKKEVFSPVNEMETTLKPYILPLTQSRSNSVDNIRIQKLKL